MRRLHRAIDVGGVSLMQRGVDVAVRGTFYRERRALGLNVMAVNIVADRKRNFFRVET